MLVPLVSEEVKNGLSTMPNWTNKQNKVIEEFNRASKDSAEASGNGSANPPKKTKQKKPPHKPRPSDPMPSMAKPKVSKALAPKVSNSSVPPPSSSSSMAVVRASTPGVLASCQRTEGFPIASIAASSASACGQPSSPTPKLKKKPTAGRGTRPSPKSKAVVPHVIEHGLADEDELA